MWPRDPRASQSDSTAAPFQLTGPQREPTPHTSHTAAGGPPEHAGIEAEPSPALAHGALWHDAGRHLTLCLLSVPRPAGGHHAGLHEAPPAAAQHAPARPPLLLPRSQLPRPGPPPAPQRPLPPAPGPRCPGPRLSAQRRGQEVSASGGPAGRPPEAFTAPVYTRETDGETGACVHGLAERVAGVRGVQAPNRCYQHPPQPQGA